MKTHKKITTGFVIQDFITLPNGTMVCQNQTFVAGDTVDYEDGAGNTIEVDTTKEVYCPFEMAAPKQIGQSGLKFVCPECQGTQLECVEHGDYSSEVTNIDEEGDFDYGTIDADGGEVRRFQCLHCGFILSDKWDANCNEEVVLWVQDNCKQDESYIDPRYLDDNSDKFENE